MNLLFVQKITLTSLWKKTNEKRARRD